MMFFNRKYTKDLSKDEKHLAVRWMLDQDFPVRQLILLGILGVVFSILTIILQILAIVFRGIHFKCI